MQFGGIDVADFDSPDRGVKAKVATAARPSPARVYATLGLPLMLL